MFTANIGKNQGFFHPHHHQCRDPKCDLWQRQCDVWQCVTRPAPSDWSYVHNVGSPAQCNTTHCSRQHRNETPHQIQLGLLPGLLLWPPTSLYVVLEKLRYSNHRNRQTSWNNWMENNKPKFQIWILWNFASKAWFRKEVWARDTQVLCDYLQTVAHLNPSCLCNASLNCGH